MRVSDIDSTDRMKRTHRRFDIEREPQGHRPGALGRVITANEIAKLSTSATHRTCAMVSKPSTQADLQHLSARCVRRPYLAESVPTSGCSACLALMTDGAISLNSRRLVSVTWRRCNGGRGGSIGSRGDLDLHFVMAGDRRQLPLRHRQGRG